MSLGRISGPMLKQNLLREGVDLSFETDLLYLDVTNNRVGINKSSPGYSLDVSGTTRSDSVSISGNANIGNINISGDTISSDTNIINLGSTNDVVYQTIAKINDITIQDNTIITNNGNKNLELSANGTGLVNVSSDLNVTGNLHVTGNISTEGNLTVGNAVTDTLTINSRIASDIIPETTNTYSVGSETRTWNKIYSSEIVTNTVTSLATDSNLNIYANGNGSVLIENISFNSNQISSSGNISINPQSGYTLIDSTGSVKLPVGDTSQRPTSSTGQIRYNNQINRFEGYDGSNWIQLNGVIDLDGDTFVTAELVPGANDNVIRFTVGGTVVASVDSEKLNADKISVDSIEINNNQISNTVTDQDLNIITTGTGKVIINNFEIYQNNISNSIPDAVTVFSNTGNGYTKFSGTGGLVIPVGTDSQRPGAANREIGMMRYNTNDQRVEIFDGSIWTGIGGAGSGINRSDAEKIAFDTITLLG